MKRALLAAWTLVMLLSYTSTGLAVGVTEPGLIEAARRGDHAVVRTLLERGTDVNVRAGDGATALHWAAYRDDLETATLLTRAGANVNAVNDVGVTSLWVASANASPPLIAALLKAGADPNAAPPTGGTPLMIASRVGNREAVKLLLAHGAQVNATEGSRGQTALMYAVAQKHPDVVRALLEGGADVHARSHTWPQYVLLCCPEFVGDSAGTAWIDQGGSTALLFAARHGDIESARLLLAAGAHVDDQAPVGATPLVVAALSGHGAFAAFLLEKGANPNAAGAGYTALHAAVMKGDLGLVEALLASGANPDARITKGSPARRSSKDSAIDKALISATAFLEAARYRQVTTMRLLAAGGADPLLTTDGSKTPLMMAVEGEKTGEGLDKPLTEAEERGALDAARLAIELGVGINAATEAGDTALHIAASKRLDSVVQFLADRGATLDLKNKQGQTPLAMAMMALPRQRGAFAGARKVVLDDHSTENLLRKLGAKE